MGGAILTGALHAGVLDRDDIGIYHADALRGIELAGKYGVTAIDEDGLAASGHVLIAVKPQAIGTVARALKRSSGAFISLMAGVSLRSLSGHTGSQRILRAMPNMGARVGLSATALAAGPAASQADLGFATSLFSAVGSVHRIPESLFDAFTGLAGSGPAFAAVVAEALADGGVRAGLPRSQSRELARQVLLATAMLLQEDTPAALKDEVASPGGTAIAGLMALEQHGLRYSLMQAVEQAALRAAELAGNDG